MPLKCCSCLQRKPSHHGPTDDYCKVTGRELSNKNNLCSVCYKEYCSLTQLLQLEPKLKRKYPDSGGETPYKRRKVDDLDLIPVNECTIKNIDYQGEGWKLVQNNLQIGGGSFALRFYEYQQEDYFCNQKYDSGFPFEILNNYAAYKVDLSNRSKGQLLIPWVAFVDVIDQLPDTILEDSEEIQQLLFPMANCMTEFKVYEKKSSSTKFILYPEFRKRTHSKVQTLEFHIIVNKRLVAKNFVLVEDIPDNFKQYCKSFETIYMSKSTGALPITVLTDNFTQDKYFNIPITAPEYITLKGSLMFKGDSFHDAELYTALLDTKNHDFCLQHTPYSKYQIVLDFQEKHTEPPDDPQPFQEGDIVLNKQTLKLGRVALEEFLKSNFFEQKHLKDTKDLVSVIFYPDTGIYERCYWTAADYSKSNKFARMTPDRVKLFNHHFGKSIEKEPCGTKKSTVGDKIDGPEQEMIRCPIKYCPRKFRWEEAVNWHIVDSHDPRFRTGRIWRCSNFGKLCEDQGDLDDPICPVCKGVAKCGDLEEFFFKHWLRKYPKGSISNGFLFERLFQYFLLANSQSEENKLVGCYLDGSVVKDDSLLTGQMIHITQTTPLKMRNGQIFDIPVNIKDGNWFGFKEMMPSIDFIGENVFVQISMSDFNTHERKNTLAKFYSGKVQEAARVAEIAWGYEHKSLVSDVVAGEFLIRMEATGEEIKHKLIFISASNIPILPTSEFYNSRNVIYYPGKNVENGMKQFMN